MSGQILIIDTKAGNLFSLRAAIERLGYAVTILDKPDDGKYDGIVIPGQGRFGTVLTNIRANGWVDYLNQARQQSIPMLGICVGMQIFFEASAEDEGAEGIGWYKGHADALDFPKKPMVGWAELVNCPAAARQVVIEQIIPSGAIVYFVNSYAIKESEHSIATTTYGETFTAAIREGSFTGVQFHPEKSSSDGAEIIRRALLPVSQVQGESV